MHRNSGGPIGYIGWMRWRPKFSRGPVALCAAALALAALGLATASATAAPKRSNGLIAFSGKRGEGRVIYTRRSNGTRLRRIATGGGRVDYPAFSPLGRRIAETKSVAGGTQIWVGYLDGAGLRLTTGPTDTMPTWSPDAAGLAFARGPKGRRDIYKILADGSGLRRLTRSARNEDAPAWSARGRIAFVRRNKRSSDIYVINSKGGRARQITRSPDSDLGPTWSPSGRTLIYSKGVRATATCTR